MRDDLEQVRQDLDDLKAWRTRIHDGLRRLDSNIELDDVELNQWRAEIDADAQAIAASITDEQIMAAFNQLKIDAPSVQDKGTARDRVCRILGRRAAIEAQRPLTRGEGSRYKLQLELLRGDYEDECCATNAPASLRRSNTAFYEGTWQSHVSSQVFNQGKAEMDDVNVTVTDEELDAELKKSAMMICERRQTEDFIQGFRDEARQAIATIKTRRLQGIATANDERHYTNQVQFLAYLIKNQERRLREYDRINSA